MPLPMPPQSRADQLLGPLPTGWTVWNHPRVAHVHGRYETSKPPQNVRMCCAHCGATWQVSCDSGRVREHISRFAFVHVECKPKG